MLQVALVEPDFITEHTELDRVVTEALQPELADFFEASKKDPRFWILLIRDPQKTPVRFVIRSTGNRFENCPELAPTLNAFLAGNESLPAACETDEAGEPRKYLPLVFVISETSPEVPDTATEAK